MTRPAIQYIERQSNLAKYKLPIDRIKRRHNIQFVECWDYGVYAVTIGGLPLACPTSASSSPVWVSLLLPSPQSLFILNFLLLLLCFIPSFLSLLCSLLSLCLFSAFFSLPPSVLRVPLNAPVMPGCGRKEHVSTPTAQLETPKPLASSVSGRKRRSQ